MTVGFAIWTLVAYLLGAVPFGLVIGLARGVDIRQHGSRNIGATNAGRVLGRNWGLLCLALDILKGLVPAWGASWFVGPQPGAAELSAWIGVGVAAVLGHTFPIYLGFRGGKGVATTIGVGLGIWPYYTVPMVAALLVYAVLRFSSGFVSLGSLGMALAFPIAFFVTTRVRGESLRDFWPMQLVALLLAVLIFVRHRSNIARLLRGREQQLSDPLDAQR
ncbi:MAG: Glycerol-3-phosphate acyltransferase [Phycisphaerae bacterium]|nr:Glycerol-3-phosphate acyltransferase [Phycisphaerae bacterium]